jgi:hypothetical protein
VSAKILPIGLALSLILLCGCNGTFITARRGADNKNPRVFPIRREAADRIVAKVMQSEFIGAVPVTDPYPGYQGTMNFAFDSYTVVACMIAAKGRNSDGSTVDGFAFEVSQSGTTWIDGSVKANLVFNRILSEAYEITNPIPLVSLAPTK